jgi:hypothetical protein
MAIPLDRKTFYQAAHVTLFSVVYVTLLLAASGHYNIDNTTVRAHVSAAGGKGGLINELLAARGVGSPVKFIVSVTLARGRTTRLALPKRLRR